MLHLYTQNGLNIAVDVESGSIHVLEPAAYEICKQLMGLYSENGNRTDEIVIPKVIPQEILTLLSPKFGEETISSAYEELYGLFCDEMLFARRDYEINLPEEYPIKALCLHISHDCNLRCKYCFAEGGDFGKGKKHMSFEVAKKAIDFVIERSGERKNIEIDFFGGEPLVNFDVVKKTVEYARSVEKSKNKNFRFTLTTNGVLLNDEITDYINREMSNVVLSLDGRKEVNDSVRKNLGGQGSYDGIVPKFQKLVEKRNHENYYIRGTFTSKNLDFSKDVEHIRSLGFEQVSVEPVVLDDSDNLAIKEEHLEEIFKEYENLTNILDNINKKGEFFNFFHFMVDLEQGPCIIKRVKGCGCGTEYVAITPDGDIFPCHRFVGMDKFCIGNVLESFETDGEMTDYFKKSTVLDKPECEKCWVKYYCSGGCPANNYNSNGDILKPHKISCELEKKRIECAITLKAMENG